MKLIVGIDFGTSTTVVRYRMEDSEIIQSLKDANGTSDIIPTVIFRNSDYDTTEYGVQALTSATSAVNGETIANFKMDLLDPEKREHAKELIEEYLKYIYSLFKEQTKGLYPTSTEINISYPAKWDDTMVKIMKNAVAKAGFEGKINGRKEPEAATRNMLNNHLKELQRAKLLGVNKPLRIFMLDMGAGTTDISIFKLTIDDEGIPNITELLSYPSKEEVILCGGREIDLSLQDYIFNYCKGKGLALMPDCVELPNVKHWKDITVSPKLKTEQPFPLFTAVSLALKYSGRNDLVDGFSFDRSDFEQATKEHWKKLYSLIKSAMAQYKYAKPEDIDFVCLTGGHSAWYTIPKLFNGEGVCNYIAKDGKDPDALNFKKLKDEPWRMHAVLDALPHESVARGLCLMDQRMIYVTPSSNNVWARITINNEAGEIIQVVNKLEDVLPVEKEISHEINIERNHVFGDLTIDAQIDIYIGETLENAEHRVLKLKQDEGSVLGRLIGVLFIFPLLVPLALVTKLSMKMTMTDEGLLEIDGEFKVDSSSTKFTFDDLQLIENK